VKALFLILALSAPAAASDLADAVPAAASLVLSAKEIARNATLPEGYRPINELSADAWARGIIGAAAGPQGRLLEGALGYKAFGTGVMVFFRDGNLGLYQAGSPDTSFAWNEPFGCPPVEKGAVMMMSELLSYEPGTCRQSLRRSPIEAAERAMLIRRLKELLADPHRTANLDHHTLAQHGRMFVQAMKSASLGDRAYFAETLITTYMNNGPYPDYLDREDRLTGTDARAAVDELIRAVRELRSGNPVESGHAGFITNEDVLDLIGRFQPGAREEMGRNPAWE
jgi:hypothetical protein